MASNTEDRLPTTWIPGFAASIGADLQEGWTGGDYRARLTGRTAAYPWELVMDGHLDTDYACTTWLRQHAPPGPGFTVTVGSPGGPATGTEFDLALLVGAMVRSLLGKRVKGTAAEGNRRGGGLAVDDPGQVLTPESLGWLEVWPDSVQARNNLHRDTARVSYSSVTGVIDCHTENRWGQAVVAHQVAICQWLVRRLEGMAASDPPG